jgi:hypothetical protein
MRRRSLAILVAVLTTLSAPAALAGTEVPFERGIHARLQERNFDVWVVNPTTSATDTLTLSTEVVSLDGRPLLQRSDEVRVESNGIAVIDDLDIAALVRRHGSVLVSLRLFERGAEVWSKTWWRGTEGDSNLDVVDVRRTTIHANSAMWQLGDENHVVVLLENKSRTPALGLKLRLVDAGGEAMQPVLYSDNDISLLPGEARRVDIYYPSRLGSRPKVDIHGWNVRAGKVRVAMVQQPVPGTGYPNYYDYTRTWTPPARASSAEVKLPRK